MAPKIKSIKVGHLTVELYPIGQSYRKVSVTHRGSTQLTTPEVLGAVEARKPFPGVDVKSTWWVVNLTKQSGRTTPDAAARLLVEANGKLVKNVDDAHEYAINEDGVRTRNAWLKILQEAYAEDESRQRVINRKTLPLARVVQVRDHEDYPEWVVLIYGERWGTPTISASRDWAFDPQNPLGLRPLVAKVHLNSFNGDAQGALELAEALKVAADWAEAFNAERRNPGSWCNWVFTNGDAVGSTNSCRYATEREARTAGAELASRWTLVTCYEARKTKDPVNYVFDFDRYASISMDRVK